jgi:hypothetical protein
MERYEASHELIKPKTATTAEVSVMFDPYPEEYFSVGRVCIGSDVGEAFEKLEKCPEDDKELCLVRNAVSFAWKYENAMVTMVHTKPELVKMIAAEVLVKQAEPAIDVVKVRKLFSCFCM